MAAVKKAAPGPMLSAGWQDGDPAPVVMQADTRHRSALHVETLPKQAAECTATCHNFQENAARSTNRGRRGRNWRAALDRADEIRFARIDLKKQVKAGTLQLSDLVFASAELEAIRTATVFDVLLWKPRVGYSRARKLTNGIVSETLTFAAFSTFGEATRKRLVERLIEMEEAG